MMINHWMIRSFDACEVDDHFQSLVEIMLDLYSFTRSKLTSLQMTIYIYILIGGLEHFLCSIIYGIILPID